MILSLAQAGVAALGARALGAAVLARIPAVTDARFGHPALRLAADTAVGLIVVSHVVLAAVLLHVATPAFFAVLLGMLATAAVVAATAKDATATADEAATQGRAKPGVTWERVRPRDSIEWALATAALALIAWVSLLAQLPAVEPDALTYHLEIPRQLLANGGDLLFVDNMYGYFPLFGEMHFLFGLALAGEPAAKLFHSLYGLLLALAIYGFGREWLSRKMAALATLLFVTVPSVMQMLAYAYVDLMFALYVFLAFAALLRYFGTRQLGWSVVAGVMAGGAWATKYTGLQVVLMLLLLLLVEHLWSRRKNIPRAAMVLPVIAFLLFCPYLARNLAVTGWPLFPFSFGNLPLNPEINWDAERGELLLDFLDLYGKRSDETAFVDRLVAPVKVFLTGQFWDYEGYDGMIGPVFLLVPMLLFRRKLPRHLKLVAMFAGLYVYYWSVTTLQIRFLLPAIPALAVLLCYGLSQRRYQLLPSLVTALAIVSAGFGVHQNLMAQPWDIDARPWDYWAGRESREEYVNKRVGFYPLYNIANDTLGPNDTVYLVDMRHLAYFLECRWRADFIFQHWSLASILSEQGTAYGALRALRARGITHLMIDENMTFGASLVDQPMLAELLRNLLLNHAQRLARNPRWPGQTFWELHRELPQTTQ